MSIINTDNLKNILSKFKEKIYTSINKNSDDISQLSNPNLLINGDFQVWQRGESFEGDVFTSRYCCDRWVFVSDNGDSMAKIYKVDNGVKINQSLDSAAVIARYYMEEKDLKRIRGKTVTLSYSLNDTIYKETFIVSKDLLENEVLIYIYMHNASILNWVKLEVGENATTFIPRSYGEELHLCQRYYEVIPYHISTCVDSAKTTGYIHEILPYKVKKRTNPTVKFSDLNGNIGYCNRGIIATTNTGKCTVEVSSDASDIFLAVHSPSGVSAILDIVLNQIQKYIKEAI